MFYPPTSGWVDFLIFTLFGKTVEFGYKQYTFKDEEEFLEIVKKYKEFAKANRGKFLELYKDSRRYRDSRSI